MASTSAVTLLMSAAELPPSELPDLIDGLIAMQTARDQERTAGPQCLMTMEEWQQSRGIRRTGTVVKIRRSA